MMDQIVRSLEENLLLDGWYETNGLNKFTGEPNIYAYVGLWTLNLYRRQSGYGFTVKAIEKLSRNIVQQSSQDKDYWSTREACKPKVIEAVYFMTRKYSNEEIEPLRDSEAGEGLYELFALMDRPVPRPKRERRFAMNRRV